MERTLHRNLLRYAVQRAIFNGDGSIADIRRSVLVEVNIAGKSTFELMSAASFDRLPSLSDTIAALPPGSTIEVWDGRELYGRRKGDGYYLYTSETLATVSPVDQPSLF